MSTVGLELRGISESLNRLKDTFVCVHSLSHVALEHLKELDGCVPIELDLVREPWQCGGLEHGTFDILHHVSLFSKKSMQSYSLYFET